MMTAATNIGIMTKLSNYLQSHRYQLAAGWPSSFSQIQTLTACSKFDSPSTEVLMMSYMQSSSCYLQLSHGTPT